MLLEIADAIFNRGRVTSNPEVMPRNKVGHFVEGTSVLGTPHGSTRIFATMKGSLNVVPGGTASLVRERSCWLETTATSDTGPIVGKKLREEGKSKSVEPLAMTCLAPFKRSMRMTCNCSGSAA